MAPEDARRIAAALGLDDRSSDRALGFHAAGKPVAWSWMERVHPRKPRVPRLEVLAVPVRAELKDILLAEQPERYVDDPHYRGYPAVLVRLDALDEDGLRALLDEGLRTQKQAARMSGVLAELRKKGPPLLSHGCQRAGRARSVKDRAPRGRVAAGRRPVLERPGPTGDRLAMR